MLEWISLKWEFVEFLSPPLYCASQKQTIVSPHLSFMMIHYCLRVEIPYCSDTPHHAEQHIVDILHLNVIGIHHYFALRCHDVGQLVFKI